MEGHWMGSGEVPWAEREENGLWREEKAHLLWLPFIFLIVRDAHCEGTEASHLCVSSSRKGLVNGRTNVPNNRLHVCDRSKWPRKFMKVTVVEQRLTSLFSMSPSCSYLCFLLCYSAKADVTKYRCWGGLNNRCFLLTVPEAGRLRLGCRCGPALVKALFAWATDADFSLWPHQAFPGWVSGELSGISSRKDTSPIGLGSHPHDLI